MDKTFGRLSVFFKEPFWVGVFERVENGKLSAAKVVFGAEPSDGEVYLFILKNYFELRFSPTVEVALKKEHTNPKRIQREIKKQTKEKNVGTKSQQALKKQQEQLKTERKSKTRKQKQAEQKRLFELKQQRKKEKRRGR